ncbi:hypothetical protein [Alteribacillus sp. HJP-4]|uniref:hypothetical protein n=1 Tax=Alteribacillus sp. HJP-4 TaxID=2775394 RepID=UPI0035CCE21F
MSNSLDDRLKRLRKEYEELPDETSPERIWEHVQSPKRKRRRYSYIGWVSGTAAAAVIGGILFLSQPAMFPEQEQSERGPSDQQEAAEQEQAPDEITPFADEGEDTDEQTPPEQEESTRALEKEITFSLEGSEQTETFVLLEEAGFPFTTYIPQYFQIETDSTEAGEAILVYAAFVEGQELQEDPAWTFILNPASGEDDTTLEDVAADIQDRQEEEGYTLDTTEDQENLQSSDYQAIYRNEEGETEVVEIFEQDGTFIEWHKHPQGEMAEGIGARESVIYDEWQWK